MKKAFVIRTGNVNLENIVSGKHLAEKLYNGELTLANDVKTQEGLWEEVRCVINKHDYATSMEILKRKFKIQRA